MSSKQTKKKILDTALSLFNQHGFVNVRLQHISDEAIISLGNITYHYRTKDDMVTAIWTNLKNDQIQLLSEFRALPLFEDVDRYLESNFALQQKYIFFYQDTLEVIRAYEEIAVQYREHISWQEQQIIGMLTFNKARGALLSSIDEENYYHFASVWLWMSESWVNRQAVIGTKNTEVSAYKRIMWQFLLPLFTQQGQNEYEQMLALRKIYKREA